MSMCGPENVCPACRPLYEADERYAPGPGNSFVPARTVVRRKLRKRPRNGAGGTLHAADRLPGTRPQGSKRAAQRRRSARRARRS